MSKNTAKIYHLNFSKDKPKKALKCKLCEDFVHVGEEYYVISKVPFCQNCVSKKTAEAFDLEGYLAEIYGPEVKP